MHRSNFEKLVRISLEALPEEFLRRMDNVDVLVRRWPTPRQLAATDAEPGETLLGIYEGIPLTERSEPTTIASPHHSCHTRISGQSSHPSGERNPITPMMFGFC